VRSNQNSELPSFYAEFVTSAGKVCGNSWAETSSAALVAGSVATFRTTDVLLNPDCFDLLPFQVAKVRVLVSADPTPGVNDGSVAVELIKQEFTIDYTFGR
jgi:hypothetical protein